MTERKSSIHGSLLGHQTMNKLKMGAFRMSRQTERSTQRRPKVIQGGEGMRLNVQGIVFTYKAVGGDTGEKYALTEGIVPPHHGAPEHIHHREDEAFYILEGELKSSATVRYSKRFRAHSPYCQRVYHTDSRICRTNRAKCCVCSPPAGSKRYWGRDMIIDNWEKLEEVIELIKCSLPINMQVELNAAGRPGRNTQPLPFDPRIGSTSALPAPSPALAEVRLSLFIDETLGWLLPLQFCIGQLLTAREIVRKIAHGFWFLESWSHAHSAMPAPTSDLNISDPNALPNQVVSR
jgi:hypothetical protein